MLNVHEAAAEVRNGWAPVFWEPMVGTGERVTVGALVRIDGKTSAHRLFRKDVLTCIYGAQSDGCIRLIDHALEAMRVIAAGSLEEVRAPMSGFFIGKPRYTEPKDVAEALEVCALMHCSFGAATQLGGLTGSDA